MRKHIKNKQKRATILVAFIIALSIGVSRGGETNSQSKFCPKEIIASVQGGDLQFPISADKAIAYQSERQRLGAELIKILHNDKSANRNQFNGNQCIAAYYLGELRLAAAVNELASKITLQLNNPLRIHLLSPEITRPATHALIKIGSASIPALIRNLAGSDDAKVRELSLQVLTRIDDDKDITQLRLQKALKAEADSQKQARLQAALKSLSETK
jgi:HEAT repeat protein